MSFEWKTKPVSKKDREINFLEAFTTYPKSVLPGATMPAYHDVLTPEQVRDIASYLSSLRVEVPSPTPLPIETPTSEKVSPTAPVPVAPPQIPHSLEGRLACLACHQAGVGEAPAIPAEHSGRTNEVCLSCHKTKQ